MGLFDNLFGNFNFDNLFENEIDLSDSGLKLQSYEQTERPQIKPKSWFTVNNRNYTPTRINIQNTQNVQNTQKNQNSQLVANPKSYKEENFKYSGTGYNNFMKILNDTIPNASKGFKDWATFTAKNESGFNPYAKNPTSTAYGYFQFLNGTWSDMGGGNIKDAKQQVKNAQKAYTIYTNTINSDVHIQKWMKKNNYSIRAVASAMHYVGVGNVQSLARTGKLAKPRGVNMKLLNTILQGKNYT